MAFGELGDFTTEIANQTKKLTDSFFWVGLGFRIFSLTLTLTLILLSFPQ